MEFSIRKGFYVLLKFRMKRRAGMALPVFLSPCVQEVAGRLYHHPPGHRNVALAGGLGTTSRGDQPPRRLPHAARQPLSVGGGLVAFPLVYLALGRQTGSTLAASSSKDLLAFFHINHGTGVVGSAS